ncbi:DUF1636 family protein [Labrenzia sp. R4_2]|uniref:DUF1636 family protein n=1 Tax=Labrenzia sp. R4_2 TaxID=2821107 RepID=UPI001ADAD5BE|nr:DUF1636 family protein [Labrenzia sp. R4_2]MBO9422996.1 DUF1636 family protein [Labrenzia sp. R4_2]
MRIQWLFADKQNSIKEALRLAGLEDKIAVLPINCLGACKHAQTVAIRGTNSAAFLFGPVKFPEDIPDIISTCRIYLETPDGWIEGSRDCGNLRHCLIGRIPD